MPTSHSVGAPPLVSLRNIVKQYGNHRALDGLDFEIRPNEVVGLLGDNGAGKSTLIRLLSGIAPPKSGIIESDGAPCELRSRADSAGIGIETIYQDIAMIGSMSIYRNMFLGREITNRFGFMDQAEMRRLTIDILRRSVEISGIDDPDKPVGALSGGQKQAVAIARAVHFRKRMLLLDEPTSALSVRETENVLRYMDDLRREGVSCVFVTHNLYHAFQVCDRFVILSRGRKVLDAAKADTSIEELTRLIVAH
ncbi:MAG: ATP-binding cassette domain-containing protein [Candidatus Kaistia colombiensis]|nr:MAG: ATP-binding cassette domain-containing protein [Kaistia sp.]